VIAEGVEQEDQSVALDEMECGCIQGYLFARPMPAADTERALQRLGAGCAMVSGDRQ
jgi:EAL domain-containing protein (putative c-di-GMP-specific phosphodiesterase class I)